MDVPPAAPHTCTWSVLAVKSGLDQPHGGGLFGGLIAQMTYVLMRCRTCSDLKTQTLAGQWTEAQVRRDVSRDS